MTLGAGGKEGSVGYLRRLAIENSSAFAGLLAKVLASVACLAAWAYYSASIEGMDEIAKPLPRK